MTLPRRKGESVDQALEDLRWPGRPISEIELPPEPGLYALHAEEETWIELRLGPPPDGRPLYVGKAEKSLAKRVGREHFHTGRTQKSTVRRTLTALLRSRLELYPVPGYGHKPSTYSLLERDDERLTRWMSERLTVAIHPVFKFEGLPNLEKAVVEALKPPLNGDGVSHHWRAMVQRARAETAEEARRSAEKRAGLAAMAGRLEIEDVTRDLR